MEAIRVTWAIIKAFADDRATSIQWVDTGDRYILRCFDRNWAVECILYKTDDDVAEFEADYKDVGNAAPAAWDNIDEDGTDIVRLKFASKGWTFHLRCIEFTTSLLSSIYNKKSDVSTDWGDATVKFYNASNVELTTQPDITAGCVKTVVDFEPTYDMEVIGGSVYIASVPSADFRIWVVAVPDVPAAYGGTKVMINGLNMRYVQSSQYRVDGRTSKRLYYSATTHTNKFRLIISHAVGAQFTCMFNLEHYKQ